jgi:hypothetical protein
VNVGSAARAVRKNPSRELDADLVVAHEPPARFDRSIEDSRCTRWTRADDSPVRIDEGGDVDADGDARPIGTLDDHVLVSMASVPEDVRHRGLGVRQEAPVGAEEAERPAEALVGVPELRFAPPELRGPPVVHPDDAAGGLAHVHRRRKMRDQLKRIAGRLLARTSREGRFLIGERVD